MEPLFRYTPTVTNFAEDVEDAMKPSTRRAWKRRGRQVLKKRYLLFMAACPTKTVPSSSTYTADGRENLLPYMLAPVLISTGFALPSGSKIQILE